MHYLMSYTIGMNISIKATNMVLTTAIEEYASKKFDTFKKFIDPADESVHMAVELGKTTNHHKHGDIFFAEINLHIKGKDLYARTERDDLYTAIDDVRQEVQRELKSVKTKRIDLIRRGGAKVKAIIKGFNRT